MYLLFRKVLQIGISPQTTTVYFFLVATVAIIVWASFSNSKMDWSLPINIWPYFIALSIVSVPANFLSMWAFQLSENPGYVKGIETMSSAVVAVLALWLFGDVLSAIKLVGVCFCIIGATMIALG